MDTDVHYNGIAVSNLVDGGIFLRRKGFENVTFTSITRRNIHSQPTRGGSFFKWGYLCNRVLHNIFGKIHANICH